MTNKEKISLGIAVGAAAVVWFLERKLNASPTSGIGDIPAWNKGRIRNFIAYEHYGYPERIVIDPTYMDHLGRRLIEAYPDDGRYSSRTFWVNRENEEYLVELCERYGVKVEYKQPY